MISNNIIKALNKQVQIEAQSSQAYLAMASWAECYGGIDNVAQFFYDQSDEERVHMLKIIHYINEQEGNAIVPALKAPKAAYKNIKNLFSEFLKHEIEVTKSIHALVELSLKSKDYSTHTFLQWYVTEQIEEEATARTLNDKLNILASDKSGLFLFDQDIVNFRAPEKGAE